MVKHHFTLSQSHIRAYLSCLALLLFASSCEDPKPTAPGQNLAPILTIPSTSRTYWFLDDTLETILFPSTFDCIPGQPCVIVSSGAWDYTCTTFPDTFWGLLFYDYTPTATPPETLYCHSDTCWVLGDTTVYPLTSYFDRMANALCSPSASSYTSIGMCYQLSSSEDTVTVFNSCFDTTFYNVPEFCLPKLPMPPDSLPQGVYIVSTDTIFCPVALINSYDDYLTREHIANWNSSH